jgi:hypothetical protein
VDFRPVPGAATGTSSTSTTLVVTNGKETVRLESEEIDFCMYAMSLKDARDHSGTKILKPVANLSKYWHEMEWLARDAEIKRRKAILRLKDGKIQFEYSPKALVTKFLASREWESRKCTVLKRDHFEIQAFFLLEAKKLLDTQKDLYRKSSTSKIYCDAIDEILHKAFRTDVDCVNNYLKFQESLTSDIDDALVQAIAQRKIVEDLLCMLSARGTVPGDMGIPHLLDIYRRLSEALSPLVKVLSDAVCFIEGMPNPSPNLGFSRRCDIIKHSQYGDFLSCLDPAIRHSESHAATLIDIKKGKVYLTEIVDGQRCTMHEHSFKQVLEMTKDILNGLFPSLILTFSMHEFALLIVILLSTEYVDLLLCVDNME